MLPAISQADLIVKYFTKQFLIAKANVSLGGTFQCRRPFFFSLCWRVFQFSSSSSSRTPFLRCSSVLFRGRSKSSSSNKAKNVHQNGSAMINSISLYLLEETDLLGRPSPEHCLGTTGLGFCGECEEVVFRLLQDISGGKLPQCTLWNHYTLQLYLHRGGYI